MGARTQFGIVAALVAALLLCPLGVCAQPLPNPAAPAQPQHHPCCPSNPAPAQQTSGGDAAMQCCVTNGLPSGEVKLAAPSGSSAAQLPVAPLLVAALAPGAADTRLLLSPARSSPPDLPVLFHQFLI